MRSEGEAEETCRRGHWWEEVSVLEGVTPLRGSRPMEHPRGDTAGRMKPTGQRNSQKTLLNITMDGDSTTSLGNLSWCWTT